MYLYPRKKTFVDGNLISYFETGKSSAHTFLILHGWGLSSFVYLRLARLLFEKGFNVVVMDLPNFGFSFSPKEKWSYETYAEIVSNFIQQIIRKKVILLGHSFGGGISLALAARHSSLVEKLVLVNSTGIPMNLPVFIVAIRKIWETVIQAFLPGGFLPSMKITYAFLVNLIRNPFRLFISIDLANRQDLTDVIKEIKTSVIILWTRKDLLVPLDKAQVISQLLNTPLILAPEHLYHDWCITHPQIFVSKLLPSLE